MIDYSGRVVTTMQPLRGHINHLVINLLSSLTTDQSDVIDDNNFHDVLASHVQISSIETSLNGHICLRKTVPIDSQTLAARWMISVERAKRTVIMTIQRGVRTCLNPTLSRQFPTNNRMIGISMYCILCLATPYLTGLCHNKATKWPRHMLRPLVGHVFTLLSTKGMLMRPCPLYSSTTVYIRPCWAPMTPKNRPKGSSNTNSRWLTATHENLTLFPLAASCCRLHS
jgi:hypothetical protein